MFGVALAVVGLGVVIYVARSTGQNSRREVVPTLVGAYLLRLVLQAFVRDIPFFSYGAGGDWYIYEWHARLLEVIWRHNGYHYVTTDEFPDLGQTTLPANLFGTISYLNGGPTRLGCTAFIAVCACLACFNLYRLAQELGGDEPFAFRVMLLTLFGPAFLMYTSDLYKDGIVVLLVTGALASSFRLSRQFSLGHAILGAIYLLGLWQVRYYLVFFAVAPLIVGLAGLRSASLWRPLMAALAIAAVGALLVTYTSAFAAASEKLSSTFSFATSENTRAANAASGSGVVFDDGGSPYGALGPKLLYTIFSPFPWKGGSLGFQIGKLDAMIFYYYMYRAFGAAKRLTREQPALLVMFAVFLLPMTVMYATTMANVGLILRQRLPIVVITALLAALARKDVAPARDTQRARLLVGVKGLARSRPV
jgi:hypothetical protein